MYPAVGEGVRLGVFRQFELLIQSILEQALTKIRKFVKSTNLIHLVHNTLYKVIAFRLLIIKDFEYVTLLQYNSYLPEAITICIDIDAKCNNGS